MKAKLTYIALLMTSSLFLASCAGEGEVEETNETAADSCFYSYNHSSTALEWTAYKTNDKIGVGGGFNEIEVTAEKAEDPKDVLESIAFTINTASVETNNEDRNGKVAEHFFGTLNTDKITGKIKSVNDNGKATVEINMHGIAYDVEGDYKLDGTDFNFEATIDMINWNGMAGIDALNEVCKDLHTGPDGVSKLWSEVSIKLSTSLNSDCD